MVDLHCHILPKMDDGAQTMAESVEMAGLAWKSGVKQMAATPHFPGTEESLAMLPRILERTRQLQARLRENRIPLELVPGGEVLCLPQTPELARRGLLPTLGQGRYVLTEFPFDMPGEEISRMLMLLHRWDYLPVVAHPERYDAVREEPSLGQYWFDCGYGLQINKDSVLGLFGQSVRNTAWELLARGTVHVIASDAHHLRERNPDFTRICQWAGAHLEPGYAEILLRENPRRIIQGMPLVEP